MRPKIPEGQMEIGKPKLESFLNKRDGLVILARVINWERFNRKLIQFFLKILHGSIFVVFEYMQDKVPCDSSSLTRFRRERLKEEGCQELLKETVELGQRCGFIKPSSAVSYKFTIFQV